MDAAGQTLWVFLEAMSACLSPQPYRAKGCLLSLLSLASWPLRGWLLGRVGFREVRDFGLAEASGSTSTGAAEDPLALSSPSPVSPTSGSARKTEPSDWMKEKRGILEKSTVWRNAL